MKLIDIAACQR